MNIYILFGSETGNAEGLAKKAHEQLSSKGHTVEIKDLSEVSVNDLKSMENMFLITSTWGDGEAPSNATKFYEELQSSNEKLDALNYGVFGIGSSAFPQFCQAAMDFDQFLSEKGAKQIVELVKADDNYTDDFNVWIEKVSAL